MKKVLVIITTAFSPVGGLATVMMNYYRVLDKSKIHIDFASRLMKSNLHCFLKYQLMVVTIFNYQEEEMF